MALTAYCKKCRMEVEPGEICPRCGTRLGKTAAHAAWCVERVPVRDWMYWNGVMRILLPAALAIVILVLLPEGIIGGVEAVERMMAGVFPAALGIILATVLLLTLLVFAAQGPELSDFVVDSRGIHETRYLPEPTPLKLALRMKSQALAAEAEGGVVRLGERNLAWKDVARVQIWPEKCMILYYSPAWWLRAAVVCTPFSMEDVMELTREKIGRKKKVRLPASLTVASAPARRRSAARVQLPLARPAEPAEEPPFEQLRMEMPEPEAETAGPEPGIASEMPAEPGESLT